MTQGGVASAGRLVLEDNRLLRLSTVALFYFAQGVPQGFFFIAIPAWMSVNGASAAQIAAVVSAGALPWTLKFINGALMDRYTFLAMGRRRAWIIGAQALLTFSFLAGTVLVPGPGDVALLSALAMAAGFGSAFQDVSIDSLAIDIMEEDERAKAAGIMFGSAMLGISYSTWLGGRLLEASGVAPAFLAIALVPLLVLVFGICVRERRGEKRLPWSKGTAHPRNLAIQVNAWGPLVRTSLRALVVPASLVFAFVILARFIPQGVADILHPLLATRGAGWSLSEFTNLQSVVQLVAALAGLFVYGALCAKIGPQRGLAIGAGLTCLMYAVMASIPEYWTSDVVLTVYLYAYDLIAMLVVIAIIPIAMRICTPAVAATQFTIYMAVSNLGRPAGAWIVGLLGAGSAQTIFYLLAGLYALVTAIVVFYRFPRAGGAGPLPDLAPEVSPAS